MQGAGSYREFAPTGPLARAVDCLWVRTTGSPRTPTLVLPDACFDLIWTPGNEVMLAAPDTRAVRVPAATAAVFAGIRFTPGVGRAVLGTPLHELLDARPHAADIILDRPRDAARRRATDLLARTAQASTAAEALNLLAALGAALTRDAPIDPRSLQAGRLLGRPNRTVASVADELGLPHRTLTRRLRDEVGYGPKTLQRVLRLQRFLRLADGSDGCALSDLAALSGYADQPHLTRDSRALTGMTPATLLAER